jgi:hypothetical protein
MRQMFGADWMWSRPTAEYPATFTTSSEGALIGPEWGRQLSLAELTHPAHFRRVTNVSGHPVEHGLSPFHASILEWDAPVTVG